ncbi:MAG: peptidoglycan-associated lipoprotein Pal [Proteobacteria bacterium]|nr:peptidoglycan-associated lipoprotein Pal [Pseudomonadota bacterium]
MNNLRAVVIALACSGMIVACSTKTKDTPPPPVVDSGAQNNAGNKADTGVSTAPIAGAYGPDDLDRDACLKNRSVYFDYDSDTTKPEFQASISCHAKYLRDRPSARMRLEGNTDERGSREYNLALGERRARSVSSAMQAMGASGGQISVVSYGEERPECRESDEACWQKNRRVDINYTTP